MECLALRFDRGLLGIFNNFGYKMQRYRGYYTTACRFAHKNVKAIRNDGKELPMRCVSCARVFWPINDYRTYHSRSFTTSSPSLEMSKNAKTQEFSTNVKSKVEGASCEVKNEDFFGFECGEGVIEVGGTEPAVDVLKKYSFLLRKSPKASEEKIYVTTFGSLRYDVDNQPRKRGKTFKKDQMESNQMTNVQQPQFAPTLTDQRLSAEAEIQLWNETHKKDVTEHIYDAQPNYLEEQYFGSTSSLTENVSENQQIDCELPYQSSLKSTLTGSHHTKRVSCFEEEKHFHSDKSELGVRKTSEVPNGLENPIEEQYFGREIPASEKAEIVVKSTMTGNQQCNSPSNLIEEQYFHSDKSEIDHPTVGKSRNNVTSGFQDIQANVIKEHYIGKETPSSETIQSFDRKMEENASVDSNFIDEMFFGSGRETATGNHFGVDAAAFPSVRSSQIDSRSTENKFAYQKLCSPNTGAKMDANATENVVPVNTGLHKSKSSANIQPDIENPKTAYDYAMKLRHERKTGRSTTSTASASTEDVTTEGHGLPDQKVDSFGFRLYGDQVVDLEKEPEFVVLNILINSALYNENDILALAKPYGLPVHQGTGHRHFLTNFLPDLAKRFCMGYDKKELYTVHRLDKETTGVILLAKTQEMANRLNTMFANGEIIKTYWALTKGVPSPLEGIIDIPIGEATIAGNLRMVLKPPYSEELKVVMQKSLTKVHKAVTHYKVVASHDHAALVELSPSTGAKHQIRVHLASALACPVLGDHKYSHLTKLAPQKLPADMLQKLGMRQSKVRTLSMHLHARGIVIPQMVEGKNIIIGARLPKHFTQNMKRLKIKV